ALTSMSGVMSTPMALPVGPTFLPAIKTSNPPPLPRSSTTSPGCRAANALGLPQERPRLAPSGNAASSAGEYPTCRANWSDAMGVEPQQQLEGELLGRLPIFAI